MDSHGQGWAFGVLTVLLLGVAAVAAGFAAAGSGVGNVDPVGATVGIGALAVSVWTGGLTVRSMRLQETGSADLADRLAREVLRTEQAARQQLLDGRHRTIDVRFVFHPAPAHDAGGAAADGRLADVVAYYRRLEPRRMVITGAPGAGKTVLAIQLMLLLLSERTAGDPVPVRLSLAGWDTDHPLKSWITDRLVGTYHFSHGAARTLVEGGLVLPVLDGLDEMDSSSVPGYSSRAAKALDKMNCYQQGVSTAPLVVTCRSVPYDALEGMRVWAHDAARVEIAPVGADAARQFILDRVDDSARWRPVLDHLAASPDGALATGLSTPWRLTLAVTVYEERHDRNGAYQRDPGALLDPQLQTADAVGEHLLGLFIPAVVARTPPPSHGSAYTAQEVRAWLTVLARYLERNAAEGRVVGGRALSGTDIVLHELWPLGGEYGPRIVSACMVAAAGLAGVAAVVSQLPVRTSGNHVIGVSGLASFAVSVVWEDLWPDPEKTDVRSPRTLSSRRQIVAGLVTGVVTGLACGMAFGFAGGIALGFAAALASGLVGALAYGFVAGIDAPEATGAVNPKNIVRNNLVAALATGLIFGPAFGFTAAFTTGLGAALACALAAGLAAARQFGPTAGLGFGLTCGLVFNAVGGLKNGLIDGPAFGIVGGLAAGAVGLRYIGLLICTRRWTGRPLPWRLGRFLHWCYGAGLIRVAGVAYQFRHRELQDHLARRTP